MTLLSRPSYGSYGLGPIRDRLGVVRLSVQALGVAAPRCASWPTAPIDLGLGVLADGDYVVITVGCRSWRAR
jgi:hypothetical protein